MQYWIKLNKTVPDFVDGKSTRNLINQRGNKLKLKNEKKTKVNSKKNQ